MTDESGLEKAYRTARVIHWGYIAALPFYVLVAELKIRSSQVIGLAPAAVTLRYVFYAAAVGVILALRQLRGPLGRRIPLLPAALISAALGEVPALLGLAYALVTGLRRDFYFLTGLSLILLLLYLPRPEHWADRGRHPQGDRE